MAIPYQISQRKKSVKLNFGISITEMAQEGNCSLIVLYKSVNQQEKHIGFAITRI